MATVVVGVDGSDPSRNALALAVDEARARHATLRVVAIYQPSTPGPGDSGLSFGSESAAVGSDRNPSPASAMVDAAAEDMGRRDAGARDAAQQLIRAELANLDLTDVVVEPSVIGSRRVASALLAATEDADLVVVGARGGGGFAGLLVGSVADKVVQHASCPVLVARARR